MTQIPGFDALVKVLQFNLQGHMPTIIQDAQSHEVLTLCYLTQEALKKSLETGKVYVFRRSKQRLMLKGETSGHIQTIQQVLVDCEGKSLVLRVAQKVAACHVGYYSCYYRALGADGLLQAQAKPLFDPDSVYK